mgnify:CR=1 FL=1
MSFTIDDMVSKYMNENESKSTSTAQTLKSSLIRLTKILDKDFKKFKSRS